MQHFKHNEWNTSKDSTSCISKLGIITNSTERKSAVGDQYYKNTKSDSLVGIRTRLQARQSEVQFLAEAIDFPLFQSIQNISWAWPASYSMDPSFLSWR
jgi:hypothetical protein